MCVCVHIPSERECGQAASVHAIRQRCHVCMRAPRSLTCMCIFLTLKCVGVREHSHRPPGLSLGANRAVVLGKKKKRERERERERKKLPVVSLAEPESQIRLYHFLLTPPPPLLLLSSPLICSVPLFPTLISHSLSLALSLSSLLFLSSSCLSIFNQAGSLELVII